MSEWGPWIEHDGGPVIHGMRPGRYMQSESHLRGETLFWEGIVTREMCEADARDWADRWVIRYRFRKPRGLIILENLIADLPVEVDA